MPNTEVLNSPNAEQMAAVLKWKRAHGRFWKRDLNAAWIKAGAGVADYSPLLQQVRNQFGPEWLDRVVDLTVQS